MKIAIRLCSSALASLCLVASTAYGDDATRSPDPQASIQMFKKTAVLNEIHHTHQLEIRLSDLPNANSENTEIKAMSSHMIQDHQKADAELKTLAANEKVELKDFKPNDAEQAIMDSLSHLKGKAFDMAYLDFQRMDHQALAGKLVLLSGEEKDPQIKSMIETILPTVRHHQQMSAKLEKAAPTFPA